ncbi:hypothetical protein GOP47_0005487 [Adiantum capillus-veneris]|uniref:Uncharacterized protein n=1 Tax=Adiantum capillus-veneris TaxID=13818 RepID=A0A9D4V5F8_ADICA|nr:hypothetical protein GOP47_0005487 [Adiantum capillus-veneris]
MGSGWRNTSIILYLGAMVYCVLCNLMDEHLIKVGHCLLICIAAHSMQARHEDIGETLIYGGGLRGGGEAGWRQEANAGGRGGLEPGGDPERSRGRWRNLKHRRSWDAGVHF